MSDSEEILVLGLGNTLREDEGAGVHTVRHLANHYPDTAGMRFLDGGTGGLQLVGELVDAVGLIVVDAANTGAEPGAVRLYPDSAMDRFVARRRGWSVHDAGLPDMLVAARLMPEGIPPWRALVTLEPAGFEWQEHPSEPVAAAIPRAAEAVWRHAARWRRGAFVA